ncbi:hypothetical protein LINPERHAP1_LOCUS2367, partial [Linum perenne]
MKISALFSRPISKISEKMVAAPSRADPYRNRLGRRSWKKIAEQEPEPKEMASPETERQLEEVGGAG